MTIAQINEEIIEAGLENSEKFLHKYLTLETQVLDQLSSFEGLQTEIYIHHDDKELEQIKFAAIFSDLLSIYTANSFSKETQMTNFHEGSRFFKERKVTIPSSLSYEINFQQHQLLPYHIYHSDEDIRSELKQYQPLLTAGKSILRPVRALLVGNASLGEEAQRKIGNIYYANGNTSDDHWFIRDNFSRDSLPIKNYITAERSKALFELTLPYFRTSDLKRLTEILIEETDTLSPLRKSLKDIVVNFDEKEKDLEEIRQDILRPEVDAINRKFRNYKNSHKWKVAGGIGAFSLSLIQVQVPLESVAAFISSVIATTGVILGFNWQHQEKLNELRENPFFLLWRIKRQTRL